MRKRIYHQTKSGGTGGTKINKQIFAIAGLFMGIVFLPSTVILVIGLLPTMVAYIVDSTRRKTRTITIGSMNTAGAMFFIIDLWSMGHTVQNAFDIVSDPMTIVIIYAAAALGYMVDWTVTKMVGGVMFQKGKGRVKAIEKRQNELIERWGKNVSGGRAHQDEML